MNTLHKKEKLCGNRQKIFFSKVSGAAKERLLCGFYCAFWASSQPGTSCREERMAAVMDS